MFELLTTLPVVLAIVMATAVAARRFRPAERWVLWVSMAAHQLSAVVMVLMTQDYYEGGDMLAYHRFGCLAADLLRDDFFGMAPGVLNLILRQPDPLPVPLPTLAGATGAMQGIAAFSMFLFADSLYAACAAIAGAAFFAKLAIHAVASAELPTVSPISLLAACLLIPSAVFWSTGLLKEPIAMIGLGAAILGGHRIALGRNRIRSLGLLAMGVGLMGLLKPYIIPVFGVAAGFWYLGRTLKERGSAGVAKVGHVLAAVLLALVVVVATSQLMPEFSPQNFADEAAKLQRVGARLDAGSNYTLGESAGATSGQLALAPLGLITALFRPFIFEVTNPMMLLNALETTTLLVLVIVAAFRRSFTGTILELARVPFLGYSAVFVLTFATAVGLATTNLGTLSRYRVPMMPFFSILLLALSTRRLTATSPRNPPSSGFKELQVEG